MSNMSKNPSSSILQSSQGSSKFFRSTKRQLGMTLLEILIAGFLLSMIGIITSSTVYRAYKTKEMLIAYNDQYHAARVVLDRLCRELTMAFIAPKLTGAGDNSKVPVTVFKGVDESPIAKLYFTSFSHIRLVRNSKESDQNVVGYYGRPNPKRSGVYRLFRREKYYIDAEPEKGGISYALLDNVVELRFRYWDKQKTDWVREWDTQKIEYRNKLPPLVEIRLVIKNKDGKNVTFLTRTKIFMSEVIQR